MKKDNTTKIGLIMLTIIFMCSTSFFYFKWKSALINNSFDNINDYMSTKFDSIYAANDGFKNNINFLKRTMLFKVGEAKKAIINNDIRNQDDLTSCNNMIDSLKLSIQEDATNLNKNIKLKSKSTDTLVVFPNNMVDDINSSDPVFIDSLFITKLQMLEAVGNDLLLSW